MGLFNPAGRSSATAHDDDQIGDDAASVIRLHYDTPRWHAELAHGRSEQAGGQGSRDYAVSDLAIGLVADNWTLKLEWTDGHDIQGVADWDERVYYLHGGYRLRPGLELVGRYYDGENRLAGTSTELTNTYLGLTANLLDSGVFLIRLQANYVAAGGDGSAYTGLRGFRDDAILLQVQIEAKK